MKKLLLFLALLPCLVLGQFVGTGINTHAQLLPVDKLRAIGIKWVRADCEPRMLTVYLVKGFIRHYKGFKILWTIQQQDPNAQQTAKDLIRWGITNIEVGNEPDVAEFSADKKAWTPERYGRWFASVSKAVKGRANLFGPATGVWMPDYTRRAMKAGMKPTYISWHGYAKTLAQVRATYDECQKLFKKPSVCTELGFGDEGEDPKNWPVRLHPADAFVATQKLLGNLPWCSYDGPNGNRDKRAGLFEWTGADWSVTTPTYDRILKLTTSKRQTESRRIAISTRPLPRKSRRGRFFCAWLAVELPCD